MASYNAIITILCLFVLNNITGENNTFQGFNVPCTGTSPQCVKDSIQAVLSDFVRGIPSLDIPTLDPFNIDVLNLTMPGGLAIQFKQGYCKGLRKCIIDSTSVDGNKYGVILHCNFTIKGKYRSRGKMLILSIDGEGDASIICRNIKIECSVTLGTRFENGRKYLELKEHDIRHKYEGQVFYKITNLFKGNPEISNMLLEFMNANWLAIAEEFGDPIVNFGIDTVLINAKKLIATVPIDQLTKRL